MFGQAEAATSAGNVEVARRIQRAVGQHAAPMMMMMMMIDVCACCVRSSLLLFGAASPILRAPLSSLLSLSILSFPLRLMDSAAPRSHQVEELNEETASDMGGEIRDARDQYRAPTCNRMMDAVQASHGSQLQSLWRTPTAAVS